MGAAAVTVLSGATPAAAEDGFSFSFVQLGDGKSGAINVQNTTWGKFAGDATWWADGDSLAADDELPDGYGIEAHLSTGRVASTRGQSTPAHARATGNLPEGHHYSMWVCVVKGDFSKCSGKYDVTA